MASNCNITSIRPGTFIELRDEGASIIKQTVALYVTPFLEGLDTVVMEEDARFLSPDMLAYVPKRTRLEESNYIFDKEADVWTYRMVTWTC